MFYLYVLHNMITVGTLEQCL